MCYELILKETISSKKDISS